VDKKSSSLNLVQRAMSLGMGRTIAPPAAPVADAGLSRRQPVDHLLFEPERIAGDAAPIQPERACVPELRLNYARCRDDKIICPGNVDVTTHNEFRTVKRRLLLAMQEIKAKRSNANAILVTSALPGEGKTFTALNLAITLAAERNLKVLLIDGDAVNPSLANYFTPGAEPLGLIDVLAGKVNKVADVVHPCADIGNLSVMFAGHADPRAPELMASVRMEEVLAELSRANPDLYILIDCSPVISPEPAAMAPHVDHAIMVVAAQQTSRHQLREALEHLAGCPQVSFLFNKSPRWRKEGAYYGYYGPAKSPAYPDGGAAPYGDFGANLGTP
jgi:receptor protein-tyrosine kinase